MSYVLLIAYKVHNTILQGTKLNYIMEVHTGFQRKKNWYTQAMMNGENDR